MQYMVKLANGQQFGPADVDVLCQWARQRRIPKSALLIAETTGETQSVLAHPQIAAILDPAHPPLAHGPGSSGNATLPTSAAPIDPTPDTAASILIPYRNGAALAAYYLAVFSLLPVFGIPLGIIALILGIVGLNARRKNPKVHGSVHAWIGIILGGGLALAQTIGLLAMIMGAVDF